MELDGLTRSAEWKDAKTQRRKEFPIDDPIRILIDILLLMIFEQ